MYICYVKDRDFVNFYSSRGVFSTQYKPKSQEKKLHSLSTFSVEEVLN